MAAIKVGESWFNACNSKLNLNRVDSYDSSFNRWKTRNDSNNISSITKEDVFKHLTSNSKKGPHEYIIKYLHQIPTSISKNETRQ